jgi:hypothetical protein
MNRMAAAPPRDLGNERISIVRLHGEACFSCGAASSRLHPAGSVTTPMPDGAREWPIVACDQHREGRTS